MVIKRKLTEAKNNQNQPKEILEKIQKNDTDGVKLNGKLSVKFTTEVLNNLESTLKNAGKFGKKLKSNYSKEDLLKLYEENIPEGESNTDDALEFIRLILENSENVLNIISSTQEKTFRQSRELIDNKLSREPTEHQPTLFDYLDDEDKKILTKQKEKQPQPVIRGLNLSPSEDRLIHTLSLLISKHSESWNQNSANYYMGNHEKGVTTIDSIELETARLMISPHELYSNYLGRDDYNTDHIDFILQSLNDLSKKNFLVSLTIPREDEKKGKRYDKLRTHLPLFQVAILNKDLTKTESQEIESNDLLVEGKGCKLLFRFNPIFTNSIREKYVEFPEDIHLRIARSSGKRGRVSQCTNLMRDFLFREKQQKRYTVVRDEDTLFRILNLKKMRKEGRKKKVNEMLQKSFNIFLKIGLLFDVKKSTGKKGQDQYTMQINPEFK